MKSGHILFYSLRALGFAAVVTGLYALVRWLIIRKHPGKANREILRGGFVGYAAMLLQITALRASVSIGQGFSPRTEARKLLLTPMVRLFAILPGDVWGFVYNVLGNILWFVPMGMFLPSVFEENGRAGSVIFAGFLTSVAIEALQWLLCTGMTDIDDVILNTAGTAIGYAIYRMAKQIKYRNECKER